MVSLDRLFPVALGGNDFGTKITEEMMDAYVELGGNIFDTAHAYRQEKAGMKSESEIYLGQWLKKHDRERYFIVTKGCYPYKSGMHDSRLSKDQLNADIKQSLNDLDLEQVDLYLLHRDNTDLSVKEIVDMCSELVDMGYTRYIGVSNWNYDRFTSANRYAKENGKHQFICNQVQFSLALTNHKAWGDDTIEVLNSHYANLYNKTDAIIMGYSANGRGVLDKILNDIELPKFFGVGENVNIAKRAKIVADQLDLSTCGLSIAYLRSSLNKGIGVIAPSSVAQLKDSIKGIRYNICPELRNYLREN